MLRKGNQDENDFVSPEQKNHNEGLDFWRFLHHV